MLSTIGSIGSYLLPSSWNSPSPQTETTNTPFPDEKATIIKAAQILQDVLYFEIPDQIDDHDLFFNYCDLVRAELRKALANGASHAEVMLPGISTALTLTQSKGSVTVKFNNKDITLMSQTFRQLVDFIPKKTIEDNRPATLMQTSGFIEEFRTDIPDIAPLNIEQLNESIVLPLLLQDAKQGPQINYHERPHQFGKFYNCVLSPYKKIAISSTIQGSEINNFFYEVTKNNVFPVLAPFMVIKSAETKHMVLLVVLNTERAFLVDSQLGFNLMENIDAELRKKFDPDNILKLNIQNHLNTTFSPHYVYNSLQLTFSHYCETHQFDRNNPFGFIKQKFKSGICLTAINNEINQGLKDLTEKRLALQKGTLDQ